MIPDNRRFLAMLVKKAGNRYAIGLRYLITGMHEPIGQFAVIGEQEQTGGVIIQPADGK